MLFDVKPICKQLDSRIDELLNMENRTDMKLLLKSLNGVANGGVKGAVRLLEALQGTSVDAQELKEFEDSVAEAKANRAKGRLLITCRTAAVMVANGLAPDLKKFRNECAALGVTIPKELNERLGRLQPAA